MPTYRKTKTFFKRPLVIWFILLLSMIMNGIFFVNNRQLKNQAYSAIVVVDPEQENDIKVLKNELISSQEELKKCVVDLMLKK